MNHSAHRPIFPDPQSRRRRSSSDDGIRPIPPLRRLHLPHYPRLHPPSKVPLPPAPLYFFALNDPMFFFSSYYHITLFDSRILDDDRNRDLFAAQFFVDFFWAKNP